jgi:hypothetical protein
MNEKDFITRIRKFGVYNLILSPDTIIALFVFILIGLFTNWSVSYNVGQEFIDAILPISAAFFSIILAGLAIITSFTDKKFIFYWVQAGLFKDVVTLFQWNLYVPLILIVLALFIKFVYYNSLLLIFLAAFFVYMIISLMDLIKFISTYALQRADLIEIEFKNSDQQQ